MLSRTSRISIVKNKTQGFFLELLRAGLWGRKPSLSSPLSLDEWDELLNLSIQQTVVGVVFDGMSSLSDNMKPNRAVILKWLSHCIEYRA